MIKAFKEMDETIRTRGIQIDPKTNKQYCTGYSYMQLYDWDQYFETIVQLYLGWDTTFPKNTISIFLDYQNDEGFIPRGVGHSNGCEEQNHEHVKPFLAQIALLIYNRDSSIEFLTDDYYDKMKKYLMYWVNNGEEFYGLSYWDSAVHTGMDNQHERAGYWKDCFCLGVDLNCYLVREYKAFSIIAGLKGDTKTKELFSGYAERTHNAMQKFMWNEAEGIFYDVNRHTGEQIKVKYIGAFATMWANVATPAQAKALVEKHLMNEKEFATGFLYPVLSADEDGFSEKLLDTDISYLCNWRANTWIPSNYFVFQGLRKYGYSTLAENLAKETYETVEEVGVYEYYTSCSKQGQGLHPFWGWSYLAYFMPVENMLGIDVTEIEVKPNRIVLYSRPDK